MKKILSIDGGGIKGVYAASLLYELESKNHIKISDYFDIIAGTSTGGIIAAALAVGISADKILNLLTLPKAQYYVLPEQQLIRAVLTS